MSLHCPPAPSHLEVDPSEASNPVEQAWEDLQELLENPAWFDADARADVATWDAVVEVAARTTRRLASLGVLRASLVVSVGDPPVVVGRLLAAASRRARDLYAASSTGRSAWESNTTADV